MAKRLAARAELIRDQMMWKMHYRAPEGMAEACCAMQMKEAQEEVRGDLYSDGQLRRKLHRERPDTHQEEDTAAGWQRRRPKSAVAKGRRAATWVLGHSHGMAAERRDGVAMGAARAMGVSVGRCFLRAREHVLAGD